jgi:hypothetical protein
MIKEIDGKLYHVSSLPPQFMSKGLKKLFGYPPYCKKCKDLLLECKDCPDKDNKQKEKMK